MDVLCKPIALTEAVGLAPAASIRPLLGVAEHLKWVRLYTHLSALTHFFRPTLCILQQEGIRCPPAFKEGQLLVLNCRRLSCST